MAPTRHTWRQFAAVLHKNIILQSRGRRSVLGSGWGAVVLQIVLPVAFFSLMCIPKYYIQPYQHPPLLQPQEYDIDTKWWAGASPYEGPAYAHRGNTKVVFVPDTPEVSSLLTRLAMAVSCPSEPYKRICSPASITSFPCLFGVGSAPAACQNSTQCMMTAACYQDALSSHFKLMPTEEAAWELIQEQPDSVDAVVVFPQAVARAHAATAANGHEREAAVSEGLTRYGLRQKLSSESLLASKAAGMFESKSSNDAKVGCSNASAAAGRLSFSSTAAGQLECGAPGNADGDGLLLDYVIRMNSSDVPPTQLLQDLFDVSPGLMPLPGNMLWEYRQYWFFLNLQLAIDRALLGGQQSNSSYPSNITVKIKPFPWPAKQEDMGAASAAALLNLLLVYAFMQPTRAVVGSIVREKELRLREGMRILGLTEAAYWCSWSLTHWLTLAASGLLCALVGLYPFRHSTFAIMLSFYWLFSAALISFSYFLSTLFTASRVAGTATQFIYALSMIPGFLLPFVRPYGGISWYLASLSPTSAASLFAASLVNWERLAAGVTLHTMWLPVTQGSSYCVGSVFLLLAADVVLFAVLTWYFDKVMPTTYGQTLPFWFPLLPSYWRSGTHSSTKRSKSSPQPVRNLDRNLQESAPLLQASPEGSPAADINASMTAESAAADITCSSCSHGSISSYVEIVGLRRTFHATDGSIRVAVEGLNMHMAAGRITALLGHNGAGKTTTIHMLTGMLQPTSGTAYIAGYDIRTSMSAIRQSLGICPQFDILWPDITVREHLVLYAVIKGASWTEAGRQAVQAAAEVGLSDKLDCLADELSGGQRRKLSVAIAFLGNPAVVFLDEPTSGMDPYSRRATWEVIRQRRSSSVIVLTTHSMEEADLLADDISILAHGRLVASGTSLSLKAQYGVGYTLTAVMHKPTQHRTDQLQRQQSTQHTASGDEPSQQQQQQQALQHGAGSSSSLTAGSIPAQQKHRHCRSYSSASSIALQQQQLSAAAEGLMQLVSSCVPSAVLLSAAGAEVSVRLPKEDSAEFPDLLRTLEASAAGLGVASYGLSVTTLEEVFLAIADLAVPLIKQDTTDTSNSNAAQSAINKAVDTAGTPQAENCAADAASVEVYGSDHADLVHGCSLYWQQFQALFWKRMLSARRDRLAVLTQLLVPLLLVLLAMAVSSLQTSTPQQPPLQMTREHCLMGTPALLAAAPAVRQQVEFRGFLDGYPRSDIVDTQYTQLYHGSYGPPLNLTLEGQMLSQWNSGNPHYDALYVQHMPPLDQLLTSLGEGPVMTLLVNQSAVSGLPAALNQATTALLRVMVAAGGARKSSLQSGSNKPWAPDRQSVSSRSKPTQDSTVHGWQPSRASTVGSSSGGSSSVGAGGGHLPSCLPDITVSSSPLPLLRGEAAQQVRQDAGALMLVLCMTMAASVLSASFVVFLVREQENNSKHLQLVSGAPPTAYWLANLCWDCINFSIPGTGIVLLVWWYNQPQLAGPRLAALAVLLAVFAPAGITATYMLHFLFKDEMKALQRLNTTYFLSGYLGFTTTWILSLIARIMGKETLATVTAQVKTALRTVSPHYCFAQGLYDISSTYQEAGGLPIPGLQPQGPTNPFAYEVLGSAVLHLLLQAIVFGTVAVLVDVGLLQLLRPLWVRITGKRRLPCHGNGQHAAGAGLTSHAWAVDCTDGHKIDESSRLLSIEHPEQGQAQKNSSIQAASRHGLGGSVAAVGSVEDDDVAAERQAIEAGQDVEQAVVVLDGISKSYFQGYGQEPVHAIKGLWLRVWPGECFGLLGVNGAGKTTTFKVLTGEITPDTGDASIAGHSVLTELAAARRRLGYCPQFEALPSAMTGREVLHMYAALRGVKGKGQIATMAQELLVQLGLLPYADVVCGAYSGGNKRKLSVAVALVGGPPLVLLDEPSTGMDPAARRFLWRVLQTKVLAEGRTIIITTHSMEEVEALASRLIIMSAGAARCCGTPQHLKNKFGDGYTLELRVSPAAVADEPAHTPSAAELPSNTAAALLAATELAEHHFDLLLRGASVLEKEPGRLLLRLPIGSTVPPGSSQNIGRAGVKAGMSLADVFEAVESARASFGITEYSLSQSSLERVFLSLAKAASIAADGE